MNQHDQMREALSLFEKLRTYGYAPGDYSGTCGKCRKEMNWVDKRAVYCRPCALEKLEAAEQGLAHVNETPKNEHGSDDVLKRAPLVRLTDEDVHRLAEEFGDKFEDCYIFNADGRFSVESFANAIMDAMERVNRRQLDQTPNSPSE